MVDALPQFKTMLEWQIDRRSRIQKFLFELHTFLQTHSEFWLEEDEQWHPMNRMVAIAFSLWRSAFLTDVNRLRRTVYDHTKEFVEKVLKHNAITFADDHRMSELTVGYYNSNARYRLERMYLFDASLLELESFQAVDALKGRDLEQLPQNELWDIFYVALCDAHSHFTHTWEQEVRPRRRGKGGSPAPRSIAGGSKAARPRRATGLPLKGKKRK